MATLTKEIGQSMNPTNGVLTISGQYAEIGDFAFQNRQDITGLIIEEGVETIGTAAFERSNNIATGQFPTSLKRIVDNTYYATALTALNYLRA